jgi:hypothetical protein
VTTYTAIATRAFTVSPVPDHPHAILKVFLPNGTPNPEGHPACIYNILENVIDCDMIDVIDESRPELAAILDAHSALILVASPVARGDNTGNTEASVAYDPDNNLFGPSYRGNGCNWAPTLGVPTGLPTGTHPMADPLWFMTIKSYPQAVQYVVTQLVAEFNLDPTRLWGGGSSAGGLGVLATMWGPNRAPQMFPGGSGQLAVDTRAALRCAAIERTQTFGPVFQQTGAGWFFPQVPGTGTGYKVNAPGGLPIGTTVIPVDTGTGTIIKGDFLVLSGIGDRPRVSVGLAGGQITIASPLTAALADNANITILKTWDWPSFPISIGDQTNLFEMAPLVMAEAPAEYADNVANKKCWMRYLAPATAGAPYDKTHLTHDEPNVHSVWSGRAMKELMGTGLRLVVNGADAADGVHEDAVILTGDADVYADMMATIYEWLEYEYLGDGGGGGSEPEGVAWYTRIDRAIRQHFGTEVEDALVIPAVYDNESEAVALASARWARVRVDHAGTNQTHFGSIPKYRRAGDLVVECRCRVVQGDGSAVQLADAVVAVFRGATVGDDVNVIFRQPRVDGPHRDGAWWVATVRVPWYSDESVEHSEAGPDDAAATFGDITEALRARFQSYVEAPLGLTTQYDDQAFAPELGQAWARFSVLLGSQIHPEGSERQWYRQIGMAVAQVFVPAGIGHGQALTIVDTIDEAFRSTSQQGVVLGEPALRTVGRDGAWWQLNVTLPFQAPITVADDVVDSIYPTGSLYEPPTGMVLYGLSHFPSDALSYVDALANGVPGGGGGGGPPSDYLPLDVSVAKVIPAALTAWTDTDTLVTFAVPLPDLLVADLAGRPELSLSGASIWQARTLQKWPSGFAKWALFKARVNPATTTTLTISGSGVGKSAGSDLLSLTGGVYTLATGAVTATVKVPSFNLFDSVKIGALTIMASGTGGPGLLGTMADGVTGLVIRSTAVGRVEDNGPASACLRIDGELAASTAPTVTVAKFACRFVAAAQSPDIAVTFTVQNDTWHLNASPSTDDNKHLQLGWVEIGFRINAGASRTLVCCNPGSETAQSIGGVGQPKDVYCYQKYSTAATTDVSGTGPAYKPHITKDGAGVFTQQGWEKRDDNVLTVDLPAGSWPQHGYLNLSGASAGCTIGIRHMPFFWPASLRGNDNGSVGVGLFPRYNPDKYVFPWRMHESRECVFSFHAGPIGALPSTSLPSQVVKRLDYPLYGRLADYSKYDAAGVFPYRLATIAEQQELYTALGIAHTPAVSNESMQVLRFRASSTTGGDNNHAAGEVRLVDAFLRYGKGGQLFRGLDMAVYLAEWAIPRSSDFADADDPGASNDGTLAHTTGTFDDGNSDQHLYDENMLDAYFLTGDERLHASLFDEADVLAAVTFSVNGNERGNYQWFRAASLVAEFLADQSPTEAATLKASLKARITAHSATTVDVDAVSSGSGWDNATAGAGARGYYASSLQNLGEQLPGEFFVARGFVSARLGPVAFKITQRYLTVADSDGVKAQGRKKDLAKWTKNELLATATGPDVPAGMLGQKCLIYSYQIHLQTPGADDASHPGGFQHPDFHSVLTAAAEGWRETADAAYIAMGVAHIAAFVADGNVAVLDSGLEVQDFVQAYHDFVTPPEESEPPDHLPGIVAHVYNLGINDHPDPTTEQLVAVLDELDGLGYVPRFGITLQDQTGDPQIPLDDVIATTSTYDDQIDTLAQALVEFDKPVFLAIGWECNGHYTTAYYPAAFRKIVDMVRAAGATKVAFVWGIEATPASNYDDWYPGDAYVDWFAVDVFRKDKYLTAGHPVNTHLVTFLAYAVAHSRRVMLLEAEAVGEDMPGGTILPDPADGTAQYAYWFHAFFALLAANPIIGCFEYTNQDLTGSGYDVPGMGWKNGRLDVNSDVFLPWVAEISQEKYIDSSRRDLLLHWSENHG